MEPLILSAFKLRLFTSHYLKLEAHLLSKDLLASFQMKRKFIFHAACCLRLVGTAVRTAPHWHHPLFRRFSYTTLPICMFTKKQMMESWVSHINQHTTKGADRTKRPPTAADESNPGDNLLLAPFPSKGNLPLAEGTGKFGSCYNHCTSAELEWSQTWAPFTGLNSVLKNPGAWTTDKERHLLVLSISQILVSGVRLHYGRHGSWLFC